MHAFVARIKTFFFFFLDGLLINIWVHFAPVYRFFREAHFSLKKKKKLDLVVHVPVSHSETEDNGLLTCFQVQGYPFV